MSFLNTFKPGEDISYWYLASVIPHSEENPLVWGKTFLQDVFRSIADYGEYDLVCSVLDYYAEHTILGTAFKEAVLEISDEQQWQIPSAKAIFSALERVENELRGRGYILNRI